MKRCSLDKPSFSSVCLVGCLAVLVHMQGGFFGYASCAVGIVSCSIAGVMWLRSPHRGAGIPLVSACLVGMLASYLVSALKAGLTLTTLAESASWAPCVGVSLMAASQDEGDYARTLAMIALLGVLTALASLLTYAGILPLREGVLDGRLQYTFQYANATAAWFACCTYLCLLSQTERMRAWAFLPATALLLTQSGGGLAAFLAVAVALGLRWARSTRWEPLFAALVQGSLAAVLFVAFRLCAPAGLALAVVAAVATASKAGASLEALPARAASLTLVCLLALGMAAAFALMPGRVGEALASFAERCYHIRDGVTLWLRSPLFGVGPDNWQYLFPTVQTAAYVTSVVHSSLVQLLVDAGLVGMTCLVLAVVLGLSGLVRAARGGGDGCHLAALAVASFLMLHSAVEFDLQFSSLACVLACMVSGPASPRAAVKPLVHGSLAGACCLALCVPAAGVGALCCATTEAVTRALYTSDFDACIALCDSWGLASRDLLVQDARVQACFALGRHEEVIATYQAISVPSAASVACAAESLAANGQADVAAKLVVTRLYRTPYSEDMLRVAQAYAERHGVPDDLASRYEATLERSEHLIAETKLTSPLG